MRSVVIAVVVSFVSILATPAKADERTVEAIGGKEVSLGRFATWGRECEPMATPWVTIIRKPATGILDTKLEEFPIKFIAFGDSHCMGHKAKGVALYYTPAKGFHGSENVVFYIDYNGKRQDRSVKIDVK